MWPFDSKPDELMDKLEEKLVDHHSEWTLAETLSGDVLLSHPSGTRITYDRDPPILYALVADNFKTKRGQNLFDTPLSKSQTKRLARLLKDWKVTQAIRGLLK